MKPEQRNFSIVVYQDAGSNDPIEIVVGMATTEWQAKLFGDNLRRTLGAGAVIKVWEEYDEIYAQHFYTPGPTPSLTKEDEYGG